MTDGLWIYGAVPVEPLGGVSVFVERLIASGEVPVAGLIDPYFGRKNAIRVKHVTPTGLGLLARLKVLSHLFAVRTKPLLVNASAPRSLLQLAPFLAGRRAPTALLLHHGALDRDGSTSAVERAVLRRVIARFDRIGCLSEGQYQFYRELGIGADKLILIDTFLPPVHAVAEPGPELDAVLAWLDRSDGPLVVGSGYAMDYYRHEWALDALADGSGQPFRFLLCCYGPTTRHLAELQDRIAAIPQAFLAFGLSPSAFDQMLRRADVYVRPSDIDSMGIAVRDAAAMGLRVVASQACARPAGTYLHRVGDKAEFAAALEQALGAAAAPAPAPAHERASLAGRVGVSAFLNDILLGGRNQAA
ncbi:MAG: glycosyltransferase [Sphingomicrobium sp.]